MHRWLPCLVGALSLLSGACATAYGPAGMRGGYTDLQIDSNTFRVEFAGNGFTPRSTVENYLLYRCAELTMRSGHDYFVLIGSDTDAAESYVSTPGRYTGSTQVVGNTAYTSGTLVPGHTYKVTKHGAIAVMKVYKGEKPEALNAFAAREVMTFVGRAIGRPSPGGVIETGKILPPHHPIEMLRSGSPKERMKGIRALGKGLVPETEAVPALSFALANDEDWEVRTEAAAALGQLGQAATEAVPVLIQAVNDADSMVRREAGRAIVAIGPAAIPALKEAQRHSHVRTRQEADKLLRRIAAKYGAAGQ